MLDFAKARADMVDCQLRTSDVTDSRIVSAFQAIPREAFVPDHLRDFAYLDGEIPLGGGRFLLEPTPLARLVQLAAVKDTDSVLDIGGGTGYGAAILARLGRSVVALEQPAVADRARATLAALGVTGVTVVAGELTAGASTQAPFDVILLEGAVDAVPAALLAQLADGGRLIAVIGRGRTARATVHVRSGDEIGQRAVFDVGVPALPGFQQEPGFQFAT